MKNILVNWQDFSRGLGLNYSGPDPEILDTIAGSETRHWVETYETEFGQNLSEEEVLEVQAAITESLNEHWSLHNVLSTKLDLDDLVDLLNAWSNRTRREAIYHRVMQPGDGILDWDTNENGITFKLAEPFLIAYTESRYCLTSAEDEGLSLKDMTSQHLFETLRSIFSCEGRELIHLDLQDWDSERNPPDYDELVRRVEVAGRRRRLLRAGKR